MSPIMLVPPHPVLPELAPTGGSGWLLVGIGIAVALIITGGVLWFGHRLSLHREHSPEDGGDVTLEELLNEHPDSD
ncbi:MAG: hypothetical protein ACK5LO_00505 [Leucobacter sp.]